MPQFFLADSLANVGKPLGAVESDGFCEIFQSMVIIFLFEVEFPSVDETVIIIWKEFQPFGELNSDNFTISMASSYFSSRL